MTANYTDNGDNTSTVTFEYTADTDKVAALVFKTAEIVYTNHPIYDEFHNIVPFNTLTAQQKPNVIDSFIKKTMVRYARRQIDKEALAQANSSGQVEF